MRGGVILRGPPGLDIRPDGRLDRSGPSEAIFGSVSMEEGGMIPLAMLVLADFAGESDSMSETTPER